MLNNQLSISDAHSSKGEKARISGGHDLQNAGIGASLCMLYVTSSFNVAGVSSGIPHSYTDPGCVQSLSANNLAPPAMLQFAKTRKLSIERSDPRKYVCFSISFLYDMFSFTL